MVFKNSAHKRYKIEIRKQKKLPERKLFIVCLCISGKSEKENTTDKVS